jgi:hypothetical protein
LCQCRRQTDGGDKHRRRNPHALLLFALRISSTRPNDLSVFSPWEFRLPGRTICLARFRQSIKMRNCPTIRADSAVSIKTWNRRRTNRQTNTLL